MKWTEMFEKLGKDRFVLLFLAGIMCVIIAVPLEKENSNKDEKGKASSACEQGRSMENLTDTTEMSEMGSTGCQGERLRDTYIYSKDLCARLKSFLQKIEGAGQVEVFVTMHASSEMIVERNSPYIRKNEEETKDGSSHTVTETENQSEVVLVEGEGGNQMPIVVKEIVPSVKGVVVAAQGAGNDNVRKNITEALQALFGIEEHKIKVVKLST